MATTPEYSESNRAGAWLDRRGKRRNAVIVDDLGRVAAFALCYAFGVVEQDKMNVGIQIHQQRSATYARGTRPAGRLRADPQECDHDSRVSYAGLRPIG